MVVLRHWLSLSQESLMIEVVIHYFVDIVDMVNIYTNLT